MAMAGETPFYGDQDMRNGNGEESSALVPIVPRVEELEEQFCDPTRYKLVFPPRSDSQFGAYIFAYMSLYHWHTSGTSKIDQEARERRVALKALVHHFG